MQQSKKSKKLSRKETIKLAREIADGFDKVDLRKPVSDKDAKRARKWLKEFEKRTKSEKVKIVKPNKRDRVLFARHTDMDKRFKKFAVPVIEEQDEIIVERKGKKKRVKRLGRFSDTETFTFEDEGISAAQLVKDTKKATDKLFKAIDNKYGKVGEYYAVKIKCGDAEYKPLYKDKSPYKEITDWIEAYGKERVKKFCLGFQVYTFKNQEKKTGERLARKGDKKPRKTRRQKLRFK